ncbi:MAG: hypothetical protein OJF52_002930 [Nitrospira sp.]|jgi:hypothetical protein|nr:MAG: hypothetical protein OJF52_002930 [Nitrospira sp.]
MNLPRFTAEASLSKAHGQYRTSRHTVNPSAQTVGPIWPALEQEQEGEVIHVHGCPAGCIAVGEQPNITCVCIPPGGAGGGGEDLPPGGRPDDGGPYGKGIETLEERMKRMRPPGRYCKPLDFPGGREARDKAELDCAKRSKGKKNLLTQLVCRDHPDGTVSSGCCYFSFTKDGRFKDPIICYHAEEVPPT